MFAHFIVIIANLEIQFKKIKYYLFEIVPRLYQFCSHVHFFVYCNNAYNLDLLKFYL